MNMLPALKELVDNIAHGSAYPVWIIQSARPQVIQEVSKSLTVSHIESKLVDNPKVDEIRELISFVSVKSLYATIRVVMITNAQEMNASSANALLKTLEEPKNNCFFLLFTHNVMQLLPTVLSRARILTLPAETEHQEHVLQIAFDLLELWSKNLLVNEIELAEKWCKLYDTKIITLMWYCLQQLLLMQITDHNAHPILKKISNLMPNKFLWAMFSKVQHALQLISCGITPNLQLLVEDLLII